MHVCKLLRLILEFVLRECTLIVAQKILLSDVSLCVCMCNLKSRRCSSSPWCWYHENEWMRVYRLTITVDFFTLFIHFWRRQLGERGKRKAEFGDCEEISSNLSRFLRLLRRDSTHKHIHTHTYTQPSSVCAPQLIQHICHHHHHHHVIVIQWLHRLFFFRAVSFMRREMEITLFRVKLVAYDY